MQCPNCHKTLPDTANVCGYCGTRLQSAPQPAPAYVPPVPQPMPAYAPLPVAQAVPSARSQAGPAVNKWKSVLLWALPISLVDYLRNIISIALFYYRLGGSEINRLWMEGNITGQAVNSLVMVGIPCAVTGFLVAGRKDLQRWAIGGLVLLYFPFFIVGLFFLGVSYRYALDHPVGQFVMNWGFVGAFGPLLGTLIGMLVKKFSR